MERRWVVRPLAQSDIEAAAGWYEEQQSELGLRFVDAVDHVLTRIRDTPLQFPVISPDVGAHYSRPSPTRCVNVAKSKLEGLFVDELARLQPTQGFMRLVKDRVLGAWREMRSHEQRRIEEIEGRQKTIRERLDRLDEAFLYERSIDIDTYDRQHDRLREEVTLARVERHARELEEMDVEGILGVRRARSPECVEPLGPVIARPRAAAPAAVLS
jgi:hypothetical protein